MSIELKRETRDRAGQAFIIVMMLTGILMIAGASLTYLTSNAAFTSRKINSGARALAIAEAGVSDMIMKLSTNYDYWKAGRSNSANYGANSGYFVVTTRFVTNTAQVVITSTGYMDQNHRTTVLELLGTLYDIYDAEVGVNGAIISGGDVSLQNPTIVFGSVTANGDVGGSGAVTGDIAAVGTIGINATGSEYPGSPPVVVPDYRPFDPWKALAITNGIYYSNSVTLSGVNLAPSNGVMYVEGDITIGNNSTFCGTLVAAGSITIQNRFDQSLFNPAWPCFLAGLDINEANRNNYHGVVFCGRDFNSGNNRSWYGTIIAMNNVTISGRAEVYSTNGIAWSPTDTNGAPPNILYGGWLQ